MPVEVPSADTLKDIYTRMWRIRLFEEQAEYQSSQGKVMGALHTYIGEEAVAVPVCAHLQTTDYITSTHRGHGHCLAKGASPDRMFAELLGKEAGYCRGKGGSMHIADPATGNLGANAIVGGSVGIATGAAFAAKKLATDRVAVCFFGEGALGQGSLYEVMNLAQLWKLPVIYVCENNLYNEYTHYTETTAGDVLSRATAFGIEAASVDGQDVRAVYGIASRFVERARRGEGSLHRPPCRGHQSRILPLEDRRTALESGARSHQDLFGLVIGAGPCGGFAAEGNSRRDPRPDGSGGEVCHRLPLS